MLDAILVVFNREFGSMDTFVEEILTGMRARGRPYREWMTPNTPVKVLVQPNAKDPYMFTAQAMVQFSIMGIAFSVDKVEYATFDGNNNVFGTVVTHWSSRQQSSPGVYAETEAVVGILERLKVSAMSGADGDPD